MKSFGITDRLIEEYVEARLPERDQIFHDMEAHAERDGVPIIGPVEGHFLYTLALASKAREFLDVGTAIGYSAMWLGKAAERHEGRVVTIERDAGRASFAEAYFRQAGLSGVCAVRRGDALTIMRGMQESFDFIFLDILTQFDRQDTALEMLNLSVTLLRPGGMLLSDNAFRSGRVLQTQNEDASTKGIAAFNEAIANHPRLVTTFVPLRDGVSLSVKVD